METSNNIGVPSVWVVFLSVSSKGSKNVSYLPHPKVAGKQRFQVRFYVFTDRLPRSIHEYSPATPLHFSLWKYQVRKDWTICGALWHMMAGGGGTQTVGLRLKGFLVGSILNGCSSKKLGGLQHMWCFSVEMHVFFFWQKCALWLTQTYHTRMLKILPGNSVPTIFFSNINFSLKKNWNDGMFYSNTLNEKFNPWSTLPCCRSLCLEKLIPRRNSSILLCRKNEFTARGNAVWIPFVRYFTVEWMLFVAKADLKISSIKVFSSSFDCNVRRNIWALYSIQIDGEGGGGIDYVIKKNQSLLVIPT